MLADVGEQLGGGEVDDALDRRRRPLVQLDRHPDGNRAAHPQRRDRARQAPVGEDRGMDAAGQVAQLPQRQLDLAVRLLDHLRRGVRVVGELLPRQAQPHRERDQPRLRAVMQIPLDAPQVGRGRVDDDAAVGLQLPDPPLHPVGRREQRRDHRPVDGCQCPGHNRQHRPADEQQHQRHGEGDDHPWKPDHEVQGVPPADRVRHRGPQSAEGTRGRRPRPRRRRNVQAEDGPGPGPFDGAERPGHHQADGQQRQADDRDRHPHADREPDDHEDEPDEARRQVQQQEEDPPPGPVVEGEDLLGPGVHPGAGLIGNGLIGNGLFPGRRGHGLLGPLVRGRVDGAGHCWGSSRVCGGCTGQAQLSRHSVWTTQPGRRTRTPYSFNRTNNSEGFYPLYGSTERDHIV
ncbi:conserved hypothetical protein [Frankia sp. Hr75.2]|nr:conserved hypothetical protein [Frankia sp. Hr75.2]